MVKTDRNRGLILGALFAIIVVGGAMYATGNLTLAPKAVISEPVQVTSPDSPGITDTYDLSANSVLTMERIDRYNPGQKLTSENMYRMAGADSWTGITDAATLTKYAGAVVEFVFGFDASTSTEMYGPHEVYTYPKNPAPVYTVLVSQIAAGTSLTGTYYDADDDANTAITSVPLGYSDTLELQWKGVNKKDFGNSYCSETPNLVYVTYNDTQIDKVELKTIVCTSTGKKYTVKPAFVPTSLTSSLTGSTIGWEFPVIEEGNRYRLSYAIEGSDTVYINTSVTDFTWTLQDGTFYRDTDTNVIEWGQVDNDRNNIGSATADTINPLITP